MRKRNGERAGLFRRLLTKVITFVQFGSEIFEKENIDNPKRSANIGIMIPRLIEKTLTSALNRKQKIILLLGARQVGKTTALNSIRRKLTSANRKIIYLNCDLAENLRRINTNSLTILAGLTRGIDFLLIDEAQRLDDPGLTLKIIHDQFPKICVLATGSSSLDLKNKLTDPLTGRFLDFTLYPLSTAEVMSDSSQGLDFLLPEIMTFGLYPEIYLEPDRDQKIILLNKLIDSYLFKDVLEFQKVRQPQVIRDLARALAYQIGSEVNENELSNRLKVDRKTVVNYLDLLEKTFVIFRMFPFSQNPRREIGRRYKIFFLDLGVRNALIGDFNSLEIRPDAPKLWENFLIIERLKTFANQGKTININFWRSYTGAEVDYLERQLDQPRPQAFEFKYGAGGLSRGAASFRNQYSLPVKLVNRQNYSDFLK